MIRPLHDYLLVQRNEAMNITKGGILLPDVAQEKPQEGLVLAAGQGTRDATGKLIPLNVVAGDRVVFGNWAGTEIKFNDTTYLMLKESDVIGIVTSGESK